MLELTPQECEALEKRALEKTIQFTPDATEVEKLAEMIAQTAVRATIATIREYEQMKAER